MTGYNKVDAAKKNQINAQFKAKRRMERSIYGKNEEEQAGKFIEKVRMIS